jgi:hypothetical protein
MTALLVSDRKATRAMSLVMYGAGAVTGFLGIKGVFRLFQNDRKGPFLGGLLVTTLAMVMVLTGFVVELLGRPSARPDGPSGGPAEKAHPENA